MKAATIGYLIKPLERTLQRVALFDYKDIYKAGGFDCFDLAIFNTKGDGVYVDDEGLLKDYTSSSFFFIQGTAHPLCGNGVVLGVDAEGESVEPTISFEAFAGCELAALVLRLDSIVAAAYACAGTPSFEVFLYVFHVRLHAMRLGSTMARPATEPQREGLRL